MAPKRPGPRKAQVQFNTLRPQGRTDPPIPALVQAKRTVHNG